MDKYSWHDLRKNPDDLPEDFKIINVYYEYYRYGDYNCMFSTYGVGIFIDGKCAFVNDFTVGRDLSVIAWKYIEPFEENRKNEQ